MQTQSVVLVKRDPIHKPSFWSKVKGFVKEAVSTAKNKIVNFVKGVYHHWESITILTLSGIGLNALLSEIPFLWSLPMWIEGPLVIPVIAVLIIMGLMKLGEWRANRRGRLIIT